MTTESTLRAALQEAHKALEFYGANLFRRLSNNEPVVMSAIEHDCGDKARSAMSTIAAALAAHPARASQEPDRTRSQKLDDAGFTRRPSLWAMEAREALELIAAPMRPDGTWNRDREACRQMAAEVLGRDDDVDADRAARPESVDALDAARYRWLHQFESWSWSKPPMRAITFSWSIRCTKEEIDSVIDAAIAEGTDS